MSKFEECHVHFDFIQHNGLLRAHSGKLTLSEYERYERVLGCGRMWVYSNSGNLCWVADARGEDVNSRRLAREWLDSNMPDIYPAKAVNLRKMLDEDN